MQSGIQLKEKKNFCQFSTVLCSKMEEIAGPCLGVLLTMFAIYFQDKRWQYVYLKSRVTQIE